MRWAPATFALALAVVILVILVVNWPLPPGGLVLLVLSLGPPLYVAHRTLTTYFDVRLDPSSVELLGYRRRLEVDLDDVIAIEPDSAGAPVLKHKGGHARLMLFREELREFVGDLKSLEPTIEIDAAPKKGPREGRGPPAPW